MLVPCSDGDEQWMMGMDRSRPQRLEEVSRRYYLNRANEVGSLGPFCRSWAMADVTP